MRALSVAGLVALVGFAACRDTQVLEPCGELPDATACPASRGGTCRDSSCSALYVCEERKWQFVTDCPGYRDAGPDADAAADGDAAPTVCDAGVPIIDPSCGALQAPDCDVAIADACPATACKEGCTGFLRCTPQGWSAAYVAYCDEDGVLVRLATLRAPTTSAGWASRAPGSASSCRSARGARPTPQRSPWASSTACRQSASRSAWWSPPEQRFQPSSRRQP